VEDRNTMEECGECGESTGGLHRCDVCSKKMHGFCGVGIGDECSTQHRRCTACNLNRETSDLHKKKKPKAS